MVRAVDADDVGGATIELSDGFVLRLLPTASRGEAWRLLRPGSDAPHVVVGAGRLERHGPADAEA